MSHEMEILGFKCEIMRGYVPKQKLPKNRPQGGAKGNKNDHGETLRHKVCWAGKKELARSISLDRIESLPYSVSVYIGKSLPFFLSFPSAMKTFSSTPGT